MSQLPRIIGVTFLIVTAFLLVVFNFAPDFLSLIPFDFIKKYHVEALQHHILQDIKAINFHAILGMVLVFLGLIQVSDDLRLRYPKLHRYSGYLYALVGAITVGFTVFLTKNMYAKEFSEMAVYTLVVLWFFTLGKALFHIKSRRILIHRRWAIRNFFLTLSTFFIRPWVMLEFVFNSQKSVAVAFSNGFWMSVIIALIVSEWYLERMGLKKIH